MTNSTTNMLNSNEPVKLDFHPFANVFPMLTESELEELSKDIKKNGQRETIKIYEGMILDGRNRYKACLLAGVTPNTEPYIAKDRNDALNYVSSLNMNRRNLTASQKAMAAARIATYRLGDNQHTSEGASTEAPISQTKAAEKYDSSRSGTQRAATVISKGIPALAQAVTDGKISVFAASKIADLGHEKQSEIMSQGSKAALLKAVKALDEKEAQRIEQEKLDALKALAVKQLATHSKDCACGECPEQKKVTLLVSFTETESIFLNRAIKMKGMDKNMVLFVHDIVMDFCNAEARSVLAIAPVYVETEVDGINIAVNANVPALEQAQVH